MLNHTAPAHPDGAPVDGFMEIGRAVQSMMTGGGGGGGGGGRGSVQTAADQSCALVKAAATFHASYSSCLLHSSEASAELSNMPVMTDTLEMSHAEMPGWLKAFAPWNVLSIAITLLVSQASGWLKT